MDSSTTPLRVPLGSLDPNTTNTNTNASSSPVKKVMMHSPLQKSGEKGMMMVQTRTPPETERKRGLGMGVEASSPTASRVVAAATTTLVPVQEEGKEERVVKKPRLSYSRSPSPSPAKSLVFSSPPITAQNSLEIDDISQDATTLTIPDVPATLPVPVPTPMQTTTTRQRLTREQARQKAEILRLRLGLADYKVKTGQTDVSLDQLEKRQMLRQWGQQAQTQPQTQTHPGYQQQRNRQCYSREMPPPRQVPHQRRSLSAAGWGEGLWEVMRRREEQGGEGEGEGRVVRHGREVREGGEVRYERVRVEEGEETEEEEGEEGEMELPRLPREDGDRRGAVSGLLSLSLARG
ncbi:hypothetical protein QBC40DRAFT_267613 [Triangularia verruculosa]|uniref:Uncharacterized protein n=1 Tax=Triangularia verruculosa TaxID=2587418 RepID=A0AAN7AQJ2_9PEZI|nr:hypothetical protein QBC40DRAFT_267613 [Triangularia verruculosa]